MILSPIFIDKHQFFREMNNKELALKIQDMDLHFLCDLGILNTIEESYFVFIPNFKFVKKVSNYLRENEIQCSSILGEMYRLNKNIKTLGELQNAKVLMLKLPYVRVIK